jgi:hypothetical protein
VVEFRGVPAVELSRNPQDVQARCTGRKTSFPFLSTTLDPNITHCHNHFDSQPRHAFSDSVSLHAAKCVVIVVVVVVVVAAAAAVLCLARKHNAGKLYYVKTVINDLKVWIS